MVRAPAVVAKAKTAKVFGVKLPIHPPDFLKGMNQNAIAFGYYDNRATLLAETDEIIEACLGGTFQQAGVTCHSRVSKAGINYCVIALPPKDGIWAVGVADSGETRYNAARVALALTMVLYAIETGEEVNLSEHPTFTELFMRYRRLLCKVLLSTSLRARA